MACSTRSACSAPGPTPGPISFSGVRIGVPICEDIWGPDPVECIAETGGEILLVPNAIPYERDKLAVRQAIAVARVVESGLPLIYLNRSAARTNSSSRAALSCSTPTARVAAQIPGFPRGRSRKTVWERAASGWRLRRGAARNARCRETKATTPPACWACATTSCNNRFPGVVLGLSGGVDSALCAAMAVDALGPARVHAIMLPYRYTSKESLRDAEACANALGIRYDIVPIAEPVEAVGARAGALFAGRPRDITEENIQSRTRGLMLMSISNKFGAMVVTTGNKSEMSVGYATLYGDMNGGFNPIKDLYKMEVFRLCAAAQPLEARGRARARTAW